MRNKKQVLKRISKSISKYYGQGTDFQLLWALSNSKDRDVQIIEMMVVSGDVFRDIVRNEKLELLSEETECINEKRLYNAIKAYSQDFNVSIQEFVPFK